MKSKFAAIVLTIIFISCNKSNVSSGAQSGDASGELTVFTNSKFANAVDTLQAVYKSKNSDVTFSYYGSFKSDGTPNLLKEIITSRNDTSIKMFMDDSLRVKTVFFTSNMGKDSTVLLFHYTDTSVTMTTAAFYWNTGTHKIKSLTTFKKSNNVIKDTAFFALDKSNSAFGGSGKNFCFIHFNLLGIIGLFNSPQNIFDYAKQIARATAGVIACNAVIVAGYAGIGALAGGTAGLGIGALPGAIIGGAVGIYKVISTLPMNTQTADVSSTSNYSDLSPTDYKYTAVSPKYDLQNTEVGKNDISVGTDEDIGLSNHTSTSPSYFTYEFTNFFMEVHQSKNGKIESAIATMILKQGGIWNGVLVNFNRPMTDIGFNIYQSGNVVLIDFGGIPNSGAYLKFSGVTSGNKIIGTMTFNSGRNDYDHVSDITVEIIN